MSEDQSSLDTNDFVTYTEGNLTCAAEWPGAQMAILPTPEHNSMMAALLGTGDTKIYSPWPKSVSSQSVPLFSFFGLL